MTKSYLQQTQEKIKNTITPGLAAVLQDLTERITERDVLQGKLTAYQTDLTQAQEMLDSLKETKEQLGDLIDASSENQFEELYLETEAAVDLAENAVRVAQNNLDTQERQIAKLNLCPAKEAFVQAHDPDRKFKTLLASVGERYGKYHSEAKASGVTMSWDEYAINHVQADIADYVGPLDPDQSKRIVVAIRASQQAHKEGKKRNRQVPRQSSNATMDLMAVAGLAN